MFNARTMFSQSAFVCVPPPELNSDHLQWQSTAPVHCFHWSCDLYRPVISQHGEYSTHLKFVLFNQPTPPHWETIRVLRYFMFQCPLFPAHAGVAVHLFSWHRHVSGDGHSAVTCGCVHGHLPDNHRARGCSGKKKKIFWDLHSVAFLVSALGCSPNNSHNNHYGIHPLNLFIIY